MYHCVNYPFTEYNNMLPNLISITIIGEPIGNIL